MDNRLACLALFAAAIAIGWRAAGTPPAATSREPRVEIPVNIIPGSAMPVRVFDPRSLDGLLAYAASGRSSATEAQPFAAARERYADLPLCVECVWTLPQPALPLPAGARNADPTRTVP